MKKTLLSLTLLLTGYCGFAQYEGFENWTQGSVLVLDQYETPANELGALGNLAIQQSTDAVDGTYSVRLETVTIPSGDTVFGYILSGDPDALAPGQPVTIGGVDSIIGYWKYDVMPGDSCALLLAASQTGFGLTGGGTYYVTGTQSSWKRFAYEVNAIMADSILLAFATGDPLNEFNGIPGTWMMIDNVKLKNSTGQLQDVYNQSFENWTTVTWDNPDGWFTSNEYAVGQTPMPAEKSTDAYSGTYALELNTINSQWGDTMSGLATNGSFNEFGMFGGVPYTSQPTAVNVYYKYAPVANDSGWVNIQFKNGGSVIAQAGALVGAQANYTMLSSLLSFPMAPDTFLIAAGSGEIPGSQLLIDHIDMTFPVGINENIKIDRLESYPNPTTDILNLRFELKNSNLVSVNLLDITGKVLKNKSFGNLSSGTYNESFNTSSFTSGIYFIEFTVGNEKIVNRFIVK
ncbi:T9SS type A sorting domain-containing protein [Vicingus serpentipes]|uniref:T9SS type A sorting domain-containing protein n=1 Tax=Vicingus serpentipes TaxID=1926625 RepID=A0A5C6RYX0_9FLAO|nr:T9SS type A sorting domain-containing protein [Vicingus serpentipes]TXB67165.1 T9SS type A sorting domain-containing protein [Vicingus serpentipes]